MTLEKIFHGDSAAGSGSTIDVLRNEENGLYAIIVTDETAYRDLITLDRETIGNMCKRILEVIR